MIMKLRYLLATPFWALSFVATVVDAILMGVGNLIFGVPVNYKGDKDG